MKFSRPQRICVLLIGVLALLDLSHGNCDLEGTFDKEYNVAAFQTKPLKTRGCISRGHPETIVVHVDPGNKNEVRVLLTNALNMAKRVKGPSSTYPMVVLCPWSDTPVTWTVETSRIETQQYGKVYLFVRRQDKVRLMTNVEHHRDPVRLRRRVAKNMCDKPGALASWIETRHSRNVTAWVAGERGDTADYVHLVLTAAGETADRNSSSSSNSSSPVCDMKATSRKPLRDSPVSISRLAKVANVDRCVRRDALTNTSTTIVITVDEPDNDTVFVDLGLDPAIVARSPHKRFLLSLVLNARAVSNTRATAWVLKLRHANKLENMDLHVNVPLKDTLYQTSYLEGDVSIKMEKLDSDVDKLMSWTEQHVGRVSLKAEASRASLVRLSIAASPDSSTTLRSWEPPPKPEDGGPCPPGDNTALCHQAHENGIETELEAAATRDPEDKEEADGNQPFLFFPAGGPPAGDRTTAPPREIVRVLQGMDTKAVIGIAVGAFLIGVFLMLLLWCIQRHTRARAAPMKNRCPTDNKGVGSATEQLTAC